jgi:hypothetical protein
MNVQIIRFCPHEYMGDYDIFYGGVKKRVSGFDRDLKIKHIYATAVM